MQLSRDEDIDGEEILWRRLTSPQWVVRNDDGSARVSSAAFKGRPNESHISAHLSKLTTLERVFSTPPYCEAVAEIRAKDAQMLGCKVTYTPEEELQDPSHVSIALHPVYGQRKKHATAMAQSSQLIEKEEQSHSNGASI